MTERQRQRTHITAAEAARRAGVVQTTVSTWAKHHPALGIKVMGRWRINPAQLQRILEGQPPHGSR